MSLKKWELPRVGAEESRALSKASGASELLCRILLARGVSTPQQVQQFIGPAQTLHDPFLMADMEKAVAVIEEAILGESLIVVYGDYDCDGITATVLLYRYLEERGASVAYYIPDREDEGYGLNRDACDALKKSGASLVVTVDNGISALEEIDYLNSLGISVVVTDHHEPREALPTARAVVNPHRADDAYPCRELAGVGVAFKLVCALEGDCEGAETLERYADLAAIGTIADVVPLTGENRTIVQAGLRRLGESENPGICALLVKAGLEGKQLLAESVSYGLAPRLNAASRMGCCEKSVDLMLCDDPAQAASLAAEVDDANLRRKSLEGGIMQQIEQQIQAHPEYRAGRVLVLAGEGWHRGIIGIVASRVVERYGRPCLLIGIENGEGRGSARSVPGFSVIKAISACAPLLTKFGGHTLAAGFSLPADAVGRFREEINAYAAMVYPDMPAPVIRPDAVLNPEELDILKMEELSLLEPFGAGNEPPLFLLAGARLVEASGIGEGKHLRLKLEAGGRIHFAVWFGMTPGRFPCRAGELVDVAANVSVSEYMGQKRLSIKVKDLRPSGFAEDSYFEDLRRYERFERGELQAAEEARAITPAREELALVYRAIRAGGLPDDPDYAFLRLGAGAPSCGRVRVAYGVLREAGLIESREGRAGVLPAAGKVNLEDTALMRQLRALMG